MDLLERKIYFHRSFKFNKKFSLRKITMTANRKCFYEIPSLGVWWRKKTGTGIIGKPTKEFKFLSLGLNLGKINFWFCFHYVGNIPKGKSNHLKANDTTF